MRLALIAHDETKPDMIEFAGSRADAVPDELVRTLDTEGRSHR